MPPVHRPPTLQSSSFPLVYRSLGPGQAGTALGRYDTDIVIINISLKRCPPTQNRHLTDPNLEPPTGLSGLGSSPSTPARTLAELRPLSTVLSPWIGLLRWNLQRAWPKVRVSSEQRFRSSGGQHTLHTPRKEGSFLVLLYLSQLPKPLPTQMGCDHVLSDPKTFGSPEGYWHICGSAENGTGSPFSPNLEAPGDSTPQPILGHPYLVGRE